MKTDGQLLYEHKCRLSGGWHPNWKFLTAKCKAGWELTACGNHIFSAEHQAKQNLKAAEAAVNALKEAT
jgi:hypothetical protein